MTTTELTTDQKLKRIEKLGYNRQLATKILLNLSAGEIMKQTTDAELQAAIDEIMSAQADY